MRLTLVTGATGKQGGSVARTLLASGHNVRVMTRNPDSNSAQALRGKGAEVVYGDLNEAASLPSVVCGVDAVFSVQDFWQPNVGGEGEVRQARHLAKAAADAGVKHFVQSTMASAKDVTAVAHFESKRQIERLLKDMKIPHTLLGTVFFMENVLDPKMGGSMTFPTLAGSLKPNTHLHLLSVEDIGPVVAKILNDPDVFLGRRINLAGDHLTVSEMKLTYRRVTGHSAKRYFIPHFMLRILSSEFAAQLRWHNNTNFEFSTAEASAEFPHLKTFAEFLELHSVRGL